MSILTRPIEELLSYLLTRLHGGLLLQQLDHRNFNANVTEGIYTLKDIQLNPQAINQNLSESVLHIFASSISKITIQVPNLFKFAEDPLNVQLQNIVLDLCSASESGCSVMREEKQQTVENEEDMQGITVLTKSISSFLSHINFQASLVRIKVRVHPKDTTYLQIVIPKITFIDALKSDKDSCHKMMKIEGLRINLMKDNTEIYDPHDFCNLVVMEKEIVAELSLTKELLFIECEIDKIISVISFEQASSILKILTGLKKSISYEELKVSILMEAIQAFGEDMRASLPPIQIREKSIKVSVKNLSVCTTLDEIGAFKKVWNYYEGIYPGVPTSHIVVSINGIIATHSQDTTIKLFKIVANHYNYLSNPALDTSELYASAKQSFFNDFFRNKADPGGFWEVDPNKNHFCSGNVLIFKKNPSEFQFAQPPTFRPCKQDFKLKIVGKKIFIKMAALDLHTNSALITGLSKLITPSDSPPSRLDMNLKLTMPYLRIQYQENFDKCFCIGKEWMLMCEVFWINISNLKDLEASASKFEVSIYVEDMCSSILVGSNIHFVREIKESVYNEIPKDRKEEPVSSYYEPIQGFIYLKPGVCNEPYCIDSSPIKIELPRTATEEDLGLARASCVSKLCINALNIRIEPPTIEKLLKFIPNDPAAPQAHSTGSLIEIQSISIELLDREKVSQKPVAPSMFSHYSLDASINKTVLVGNDTCIGLITMNISDTKIISLTNCIESKGKYTRIKIDNIEVYAKHLELAYALSPHIVDIIIEKNDTEKVTINLSNFLISLDVLNKYLPFISTFAVDLPKTGETETKKVIKIRGLFFDYIKNDHRMLVNVESGTITGISVNDISTGLHIMLDSIRVYIQLSIKPHQGLFSIPIDIQKCEQDLISSGCHLIATMDSIESFVTIVNSKPEIKNLDDPYTPLFLNCMLGSNKCHHVEGCIYVSRSLRTSILVHKLFDAHLNLGSFVLHLNTEFLDVIKDFLDFPRYNDEPDEVLRKDSDISSDDSDTFPIQTAGLTINPQDPSNIKNINLQEYLNPPYNPLKKASNVMRETKVTMSKHNIIHTHSVIPDILKGNTVDHPIHSLASIHGCPNIRFSATLFFCAINLYSRGKSREKPDQKHYNTGRIMTKAENISLTITKFPKRLHYSWRISMSIENIKVNDYIPQSIVNTILMYDGSYPRRDKTPILHFEVSAVWPRPSFSNDTELIVLVSLLPLKLNIDQHLIEFSLDLVNWKPEEHLLMHQTGGLPANDTYSISEPKQFYLQRLKINTICLNLDYVPHNFEGKHPGASILNLFQIQDFILTLPSIEIKGIKNINIGMAQAWSLWLEHIKDKEVYKLLSGIGPFSAIKNISAALYDIASLSCTSNPGNDSAKKALISLIKSLSVESLTILESLVTGTYSILMGCGNIVGINLPSRQTIVRPLYTAKCILDKNRLGPEHEKYKD
jgi:N-terminal region of Chorein or VPS13